MLVRSDRMRNYTCETYSAFETRWPVSKNAKRNARFYAAFIFRLCSFGVLIVPFLMGFSGRGNGRLLWSICKKTTGNCIDKINQ